ncbi:hypothetical protein M1O12_03030 [Dehalococcoidia bacterium]|nr:hypothetical protein [Dehalococcoidia bacterium]
MPAKDLLDAIGQGFPVVFGQIELVQIDDLAVARASGGSDGFHEAMIGKSLIITGVSS